MHGVVPRVSFPTNTPLAPRKKSDNAPDRVGVVEVPIVPVSVPLPALRRRARQQVEVLVGGEGPEI